MALNKLPDIDIDFAHCRKDDVVDLIFARYGDAHTAIVGGFNTYQGPFSRRRYCEGSSGLSIPNSPAHRTRSHRHHRV